MMWKKLISLNLALVMALSMLPFQSTVVQAASDTGYAVYHKNDGSDEMEEKTVTDFSSNGSLRLYESMPDYTAEGKVVMEYNSEADGSGMAYQFSDMLEDVYSTDADAPEQLYAKWQDAEDYYIRYIAADGTTADGQGAVLEDGLSGTAKTASGSLFIDEKGREVIAWFLDPEKLNTFGKFYLPGEEIPVSGNMTLYGFHGVKAITFYDEEMNGSTHLWKWEQPCSFWQEKDGKILLGWNSEADGSGDWYSPYHSNLDMPSVLYGQYVDIPAEDYCVLNYKDHRGTENPFREIVLLEDGKVDMPDQADDGTTIVYWQSMDYDDYYYSGRTVEIESGQEVRAITPLEDGYVAFFDGNGGLNGDGNGCYGVFSAFTSPSSLETFAEIPVFQKENGGLTGYTGGKTQTAYSFGDDLWKTVETEMDGKMVAYFTANYLEAKGNFIQYHGNGAVTAEGESFYLQDELTWGSTDNSIAENPFVVPEGEYFLGWQDEEENWYSPGSDVSFTENTNLYAQWGQNRVTYHYMRGTTERILTKTDADEFRASMGTANEGYIFEGWYTEDGQWYCPGEEILAGTAVDLYESWLEIPAEGYYYILTAPKLENGRCAQIVTMEQAEEAIVLPKQDKSVWYLQESRGNIEDEGFVDEQTL